MQSRDLWRIPGTNLTLVEAFRLLLLLCGPPWLFELVLMLAGWAPQPGDAAGWILAIFGGPGAWGAFISAVADGRTLLGRPRETDAARLPWWVIINRPEQPTHIVNIFAPAGRSTEADYEDAVTRYLNWLVAAYSRVTLRGIKRGGQQAIELALEDVYVHLAAEVQPDARADLRRRLDRDSIAAEEQTTRRITMKELLAEGNYLAVIGAPGCGKTTVLQHIVWTLAEALRSGRPELAAERLGLRGNLPLPIYVPLSLYAEHRRRFAAHPDPRQRQLATFISHHLMERQAGLNLPDDFFATLLDQGRDVIVLLDGLDEVPSEDDRALVSQAVRDLTYGRPHARFIVTSRTPAYQGRAVLGADFRVVRVLPLEPEQVADLVRRAYAAIYPSAAEKDDRQRRADDLIKGIEQLEAERAARLGEQGARLVTTPLLVRMLLIVHFNLRHLPDQRAELYMEAIDTLLTSSHNPDEAVAQKLAQLGGDWRGRRDMCQYVAFQMHSRGRESGRDIGEGELRELLCTYLVERRHKTPEAAQTLVDDFIAASRQRGGLMEEIAAQHRFTHLSFQEFLTGRYLAEAEREIERIARFFEEGGRATDSWWREPALLTLGYLSLTAPNAATDLIRRLARLDEATPPAVVATLGAAELAGTAFLEWGGADPIRDALATRLACLLQNAAITGVPGVVRGAAGRTLARLGDRRPGVGLRPDGLPDIVWCHVPAGSFLMGNTEETDEMAYDDEAPQHQATIGQPFSISKYPITNAQFAAFVADGGYQHELYWKQATAAGYEKWADGPAQSGGVFGLPNHPVVDVSWYEAMAFCAWLSEKLGRQVSLPSECQWEKAARGTDGRRYPWAAEITTDHANYDQTGIGSTSAVGIFPRGASPYGVLDMSGNVWEWTRSLWGKDWQKPEYGYPYRSEDGREDVDAPPEVRRVVRGGSFDVAGYVRCSCRYGYFPVNRFDLIGFRVVSSHITHDSGI